MTKCLKNLEKIEATLAIDACKHARDQKSVTTRCRGLLSKVDTPFSFKCPSSHIIAIEPELSNYELLVANTEKITNILILNKGLWSKTTKLEIINAEGSKYGFITREILENTDDGIETCTVTDMYENFLTKGFDTIDLLKIDIEGAEKEVFSEGYENRLGKVK